MDFPWIIRSLLWAEISSRGSFFLRKALPWIRSHLWAEINSRDFFKNTYHLSMFYKSVHKIPEVTSKFPNKIFYK